uniref:Uncharacterized protein n=1 Tax=Angiostrongylus cantonensis TaxID=6313 RepID=A0A0K0DH03_ANGCA
MSAVEERTAEKRPLNDKDDGNEVAVKEPRLENGKTEWVSAGLLLTGADVGLGVDASYLALPVTSDSSPSATHRDDPRASASITTGNRRVATPLTRERARQCVRRGSGGDGTRGRRQARRVDIEAVDGEEEDDDEDVDDEEVHDESSEGEGEGSEGEGDDDEGDSGEEEDGDDAEGGEESD